MDWKLLLAPAVLLLWTGLLLGVSFLATPVKFSAPSLSLPAALDVGRATFHILVKVEWILLGAVVASAAVGRFTVVLIAAIAVLAICLSVQTFLLLPPLDARVTAIISGAVMPGSKLHIAYVGLEALKVVTLASAAIVSIKNLL